MVIINPELGAPEYGFSKSLTVNEMPVPVVKAEDPLPRTLLAVSFLLESNE